MIGPSSSHTAGAVRIGLVARHLLGAPPTSARIGLHGSFAATGGGHATDRGMVAGLLGWMPDDERLKDSLQAATELGMLVEFHEENLGETAHPNSALVELVAGDGASLILQAASTGGGNIETVSVDGFDARFSGALDTLVIWHLDRPGFLAHVTALFACIESNVASIRTARTHRGADALTIIELDAVPLPEVMALLEKIEHVRKLRVLPPIS